MPPAANNRTRWLMASKYGTKVNANRNKHVWYPAGKAGFGGSVV
jgi:hypothetical protein